MLHRHKLVGMRTRVKNQLQHVALNEGLQKKRQLWTRQGRGWLEELALPPWSRRRREDLLHFLDELEAKIRGLDVAVSEAAEKDERVRLLRTHPGVGPVTGLAFVLVVGDIRRFRRSKHLTSYLGLIPAESSSGERRLGGISKQGNTLLRTLLVEAGQSAARCDPELGRAYRRLCHKKQHTGIGKVMVARKLVVRLYWMLKSGQPYALARMPSSPSHSVSAA